jgi:hypothetical protein
VAVAPNESNSSLTIDPADGEEARRMGLVNEVVEAGKHLERALELAGRSTGAPPATILARHATIDRFALRATGEASQRAAIAGADRRERTGREQLHSLLMSDPPIPIETLADAASAADWPLPERIRAGVAVLPAELGRDVTPSRVVWGCASGARCVLFVADDDESEDWLDRAAEALKLKRPLVISAASDVDRVGHAAARALALSDLVRADRSRRSHRVVRYEGHEIEVLLALDRELSESIADRVLAPVAGLASPRRDRMLDTLDAWLANPGRPRAMAAQLHLHVQGVRYRLAQLRDLFGDALDDPQRRFELALALRVHRPPFRAPVP